MIDNVTMITPIYAGFFGILLVCLCWRVVSLRNRQENKMNESGHTALTAAVRAQDNLQEYLPVALLLMFMVENLHFSVWIVHALGALLVIARVIHLKGINEPSGKSLRRRVGTRLTWVQIIISSALCFAGALGFVY